MWGTLLGYDLVRRLAATAAFVTKKKPREIGYVGTWNVVSAAWMLRSVGESVSAEILERILIGISKLRAGHRPGRLEPRVIRKRPKPRAKMKKARSEYRRRLTTTPVEPEWF